MVCRDAESVCGDWGEEEADSLEECLAEGSRSGSFSSCVQCAPVATKVAAVFELSSTGTPSISGTEGSSPSNGMSPQSSSPSIFMPPVQSLGVHVAAEQ